MRVSTKTTIYTLPMKYLLSTLTLFLILSTSVNGQHTHPGDRPIVFPDVPGYLTLSVDLHMHTVFSDGSVWPNIRVQEAIRDGIDAISNTEHLEYQPHQDDIPHPDRNRAHDVATASAEGSDLMVIRGAEITRSMPPGHNNAVFIEDANKLLMEDAMDVFMEVQRQGGFAFWDHPNWTAQRPDGIATLTDMHRELIEKDLLHGIEVVNHTTYSDEALTIALENDLTILGTSDIHGLVDWDYEVAQGGHRPVTLVFATARTPEAIKDALFAGRTVAYFQNMVVGKEENLVPLLDASLNVLSAEYGENDSVLSVQLENTSDVSYILDDQTEYTFHQHADVVILEAHKTTELQVKTIERLDSVELVFEVLNAITAPDTHPMITINVDVNTGEE